MKIALVVEVSDEGSEEAMRLLTASATDRDAAGVADLFHRRDILIVGEPQVYPVTVAATRVCTPVADMVRQFLSHSADFPPPAPGLHTFLNGKLVVTMEAGGKGAVTWDIPRPTCPSCGEIQCCLMCDGSQGADANNEEEEEDVMNRLLCNGALDGIETLIHCLVVTGAVQSENPQVNQALKLALASVEMQ